MPKASAPAYTVTPQGNYTLRRPGGQTVEYKKFKHEPLSNDRSIRLIKRIRTNKEGNPLDYFSIEERSLDDPTLKYVPISYVWGELPPTAPLILGDDVDAPICLITKTAWEAIQTICILDYPVWIDQICINQTDDAERTAQLELMGEIYSSHKRAATAVWLGACDDETEVAFNLVATLSKVMPLTMTIPISTNDALHMPHDMVRKEIQKKYPDYKPPPDHDPSWASLRMILGRTWFLRMWTFQEVVLSDLDSVSIISANEKVRKVSTLREVIRAAMLLGDYPIPDYDDAVTENRSSLYSVNQIQHRLENREPTPLHYLLQVTASRGCKEPKDKIYALLAAQRNNLPMETIVADYKKADSEVYADATRKIIASETSILISLAAAGRHKGRVTNIPSWVPDYTGEILAPSMEALDPNSPLFSSSSGRRWRDVPIQTKPNSSWQQLVVQGRIIDHIVDINDQFMPQKANGDEIHAYLQRVLPAVLSRSTKLSAENDTNKTILRIARTVITGGYNTYLFGFRSFSFILKAASSSYAASAAMKDGRGDKEMDLVMLRRLFIEPPSSSTPARASEEDERNWNLDFVKQAAQCKGRRFAFLKNYGVGLVPHQTKVGDIVTILHGSSLPVVLRKISGGDTFHLVGPCFIDGIMHGEAVNWAEDEADQFVLD